MSITGSAQAPVTTRLLRAILLKTFLEIMAVGALVSLAAYWYFLPQLRGAIDLVSAEQISGWALDSGRQEETIEVQLFIDDRFAASQMAMRQRADLISAGISRSAEHGFRFSSDVLRLAPGDHLVQVYAVRQSGGGNRTMFPLSQTPRLLRIQ